MATGSRLFIASNVGMNLSSTSASGLFSATTGPTIIGTDYKTFMLYNSLLTIDTLADLDDPLNPYNQLELVSSSVTNNNQIRGTQANQVAIAQEQATARVHGARREGPRRDHLRRRGRRLEANAPRALRRRGWQTAYVPGPIDAGLAVALRGAGHHHGGPDHRRSSLHRHRRSHPGLYRPRRMRADRAASARAPRA